MSPASQRVTSHAVTHRGRMHLLDLLPDLGQDLEPAARAQLLCLVAEIPEGPWDPTTLAQDPAVRGRVFAGIVCQGMVVRQVLLTERVCSECFGPGDLIGSDRLAARSLPVDTSYTAVGVVTFALLDDHFLAGAQRYPRLIGRLIDLAAEQLGRTAIHQAISQLPRVENRLLALLIHLSDRWGHVTSEGIRVELPLTHESLGQLIGARRPTVSLGLRSLADDGLLSRSADGVWLLAADAAQRLQAD